MLLSRSWMCLWFVLAGCGDSEPGGGGGAGGAATNTSAGVGGLPPKQACRDEGPCGDFFEGCFACAVAGKCAKPYAACLADEDCAKFSECADECGALACADDCIVKHERGWKLRTALEACVRCEECPSSCAPYQCASVAE